MLKIRNWKTRTKLMTGFAVVSFLVICISAMSIWGINYTQKSSKTLHDAHMMAMEEMNVLKSEYLSQSSIATNLYININSDEIVQELQAEIARCRQRTDAALLSLPEHLSVFSSDIQSSIARFTELYKGSFTTFIDEAMRLASDGANKQLEVLFSKNVSLLGEMTSLISSAAAGADTDIVSYQASVNAVTGRIAIIVAVLSTLSIITSIALGLYNSAIIAKPLARISETAREVSQGNTSVSVESDRTDEIGALSDAFAHMIDEIRVQSGVLNRMAQGDYSAEINIRSDYDEMNKAISRLAEDSSELIAKIRSSSEQVNMASSQIAQAAQSLASGSAEQAASIDEFTRTLNSIMQQTNDNAELSVSVLSNVSNAAEYMQRSIIRMEELSSAMDVIAADTKDVTRVIKTIDDIAFQTNILALNAAVEAARAGAHGKGFAVVAEEVRNLANDSSVAAHETANLIENTVRSINEGSEMVSDIRVYIDKGADVAQSLQESVSQISAATRQQAAAVTELYQGLEQISQVVQANSASSEQTAAAAEEMTAQSQSLSDSVSNVTLSEKYARLEAGTKSPLLSSRGDRADYSMSGFGKY